MVAYETQLALFFRDTINIARIFDCFHDIRMHPRILLKDILISVFLMPYWGIKALLQLDILLRTPQMLRLFRCPKKKKLVVFRYYHRPGPELDRPPGFPAGLTCSAHHP